MSSLVPLTAAYAPGDSLHFLGDYNIIQTVSMHFPKTSGHLDFYCLLEPSYGRHTGRMLLFSHAPTPSPLVLTSPSYLSHHPLKIDQSPVKFIRLEPFHLLRDGLQLVILIY